jgi:hypothetical protein
MAALPYEHLERVTAGPLAKRRRLLVPADVHEIPHKETFDVRGRTESTDLPGRTWYACRAPVEGRRAVDTATTVTPLRHVPTESG